LLERAQVRVTPGEREEPPRREVGLHAEAAEDRLRLDGLLIVPFRAMSYSRSEPSISGKLET
jgi:hypothetical protein